MRPRQASIVQILEARSLLSATPITFNSNVTGTLATGDSTQAFQFTATAGSLAFLSVSTPMAGNIYWSLVDPSGQQNSVAQGQQLQFDTTGTYSLVAEGSGASRTSALNFSFSLIPVANDSSPIPLTLGSSVSGAIMNPAQTQSYTFTLTSPSQLFFDSQTRDSHLQWTLIDQYGTQYTPTSPDGYAQRRFSDDDAPIGYDGSEFETLPARQYTLTVSAASYSPNYPDQYAFRLLNLANATPIKPATAVTGTLAPANSTQFYQFSAVAGQTYYLETLGYSTTSAVPLDPEAKTNWSVVDPNGQAVRQTFGNSEFDFDLGRITIAKTGTYTIEVGGTVINTGTTNYSFKVVPVSDTTASIALNSAIASSISQPGRVNSYTFTLNSPTQVWFDSLTNSSAFDWNITGPLGAIPLSSTGRTALMFAEGDSNLGVLPAGSYTVTVSASLLPDLQTMGSTGPYSFRLLTSQAASPLTIGTSVSDALNPANSMRLYQFAGTAGEILYFENKAFSTQGTQTGNTKWTLLDPLNRQVFSNLLQTDSGRVQLQASGTYTLVISGDVANDGKTTYGFRVASTNDSTTALVLNSRVSGNLTAIGQHNTYIVTLTAPARLWFDSQTNNTNLTWQLSSPTGAAFKTIAGSIQTAFNSDDQQLRLLPPGTYSLTVAAVGKAIGSYAFNLRDLTSGQSIGTGTASSQTGPTVSGSLSPANASSLYSFTSSAGDQLSFHNISLTAGSTATWQLLEPYGNTLFNGAVATDQNNVKLPYTGQYVLIVKGQVMNTTTTSYRFQINYQGNTPPTPTAGTPLTLGTVYTNATNPLQGTGEVDFQFTLAAPTQLWLDASTNSSLVAWQLIGPTGVITTPSGFTTGAFPRGSGAFEFLPAGSYTFKITGPASVNSDPAVYQIRLQSFLATQSLSFGAPTNSTLPIGASQLFQFSGAAGQTLYLDSLAADFQHYAIVWNLYDSYGSVVNSGSFDRDSGRFTLMSSGTYTLAVQNTGRTFGVNSYGFTLWSPTDTTASLNVNTTTVGNIAIPGQVNNYNFTLNVWSRLWLDTLNGIGPSWQISSPGGVVVSSSTNSPQDWIQIPAGSYTLSFSGPASSPDATGNYTFRLQDFSTFNSINLNTNVAGTLNQSLTAQYFRFTATAGQSIFLQSQTYSTTNTLVTNGNDDNYLLYDANGNLVVKNILRNDSGAVTLPNSGVYYLIIQRARLDNGATNYSLGVLLEPNISVPLTFNSVITGSIAVPQQRNSYTFTLDKPTDLYFDAMGFNQIVANGLAVWVLTGPNGVVSYPDFDVPQSYFSDQAFPALSPGTYTLTVTTTFKTIGTYSFSLLTREGAQPISIGTPVSATVSANSTQIYTFPGVAGESFYISSTGVSLTDNSGNQGAAIWYCYDGYGNLTSDLGRITVMKTGPVYLYVEGRDSNNGQATYSFIVNRAGDRTTPLSLNSVVTSALTNAGQHDTYTFTLNAPTTLYFDSMTNSDNLTWSLTPQPDTRTNAIYQIPFGSGDKTTPTLPAGKYALTISGVGRSVGSYSFNLLDQATASKLTIGTPVTVSSAPANSARIYQFSGTTGQTLYFANTGFSTTDSSGQNGKATWTLKDQYGVSLFNSSILTDSGRVTLPNTGIYQLIIAGDVANNGTSNYSFNVTSVFDRTNAMALNSLVSGAVTMPGQQQTYTFSLAFASQFGFDSQTFDQGLTWQLTGPGGVVLTPTFGRSPTPFAADDQSLGLLSAGSYSLTITGVGQHTGGYVFSLLNLATGTSVGVGSSGSPTGPTIAGSLSIPSTAKQYSFTGNAGDALTFHSLTGTSAYWALLDPNGKIIFNSPATTDQIGVVLSFSGTYTLIVRGAINATATTNFSFQVNYQGHPTQAAFAGVALQLGTAYSNQSFAIDASGERDYQFTLASPTSLIFNSQSTNSAVTWQLIGPQGIVSTASGTTGPTKFTDGNQTFGLLPIGSYSLRVLGPAGSSYGFKLYDVASAVPITLGVAVNTPQSGSILYGFTGTAGDTFNIVSTSFPNWTVYDQSGVPVPINANALNLPGAKQLTLPSTGRYTFIMTSQDAPFTIWPAVNQSKPVTFDTPVNGNMTTPAQVDTYTFNVTSPTRFWFDPQGDPLSFNWRLASLGNQVNGLRYFQDMYLGTLLPGNYSLSIEANSGKSGAYAFQLLTLPVTPAILVTGGDGIYTGSSHPVVATFPNLGGGQVSGTAAFTYYVGSEISGGGSPTPPANAGTYTVVGTFTSDDLNYGSTVISPVTFTISKATPTVVITNAGGTFNGNPFPATSKVTGVGGVVVNGVTTLAYYSGSSVSGTGTTTAPTNAGTYTVVATFTSSNSNYGNASSTPVTFTISKATPAIVVTNAGGTFNGNMFPALVKVTGVGGAVVSGTTSLMYYAGSSASGTGSRTAPSKAGTYTVVATFASSDANYGNATSNPITFTIAKATPTVVAMNAGGMFNGNLYPTTVKVSGIDGATVAGASALTYYVGTSATGVGSPSAPKNAGTYTVVAAFTSGTGNYENTTSAPVTFTIAKATPTIEVTNAGGTFRASPFPATAKVTGVGGTVINGTTTFTYYVGSSVSGAGSTTAPTNAGTYTVIAEFASSNANYNNTMSVPLTFTISKALPTVVAFNSGGTFNGNPFPATGEGDWSRRRDGEWHDHADVLRW